MPARRQPPATYLLALAVVATATLVGFVARGALGTIDLAMLFLLAVVIVGAALGGGPALLAAALSVAIFDFVFVPPFYTFAVNDKAYYLTFGVMFIVALVMGNLTARIRAQAEEAAARESLTAALAALDLDLARATEPGTVHTAALRHLHAAVPEPATISIVFAASGPDGGPHWPAGELDVLETRLAADAAWKSGLPAGWGAPQYPDADVLAIPLKPRGDPTGVVLIRPDRPDQRLDPAVFRTVTALAARLAYAFDRSEALNRNESARLELETERLRTALLSSLSHDFRTPLSTIEGAASSLVEDGDTLSGEARQALAETVQEEAGRLNRMVGNLLDMVRLEAGLLAVNTSWQPLEEALGVALLRLEHRLEAYPVTTHLPPELSLVPIDELLVEQVFINLLENVVRHTPPGTPITITAREDAGTVLVEVHDAGPGVPADRLEAVFERFRRARPEDESTAGAGLGLTICRGIVTAHGGRIWIEPGGPGTTVRFTLPLHGERPPAVAEAAGSDVAAG